MDTICVDFDGVIHSYDSGWHGAGVVSDEPVPGAFEFLYAMLQASTPDGYGAADATFDVCIYSSRSGQAGGIMAMQTWFIKHGFDRMALGQIRFPDKKPADVFLTIDDRAICFDGTFPSIKAIQTFKPWHKK